MGILINLKVTVMAYAQNLASILHITVDQFILFSNAEQTELIDGLTILAC